MQAEVGLAAMDTSRWRQQDWGQSNHRQNLSRVAAHRAGCRVPGIRRASIAVSALRDAAGFDAADHRWRRAAMGQWRHALHVLVCEVQGERALLAVHMSTAPSLLL